MTTNFQCHIPQIKREKLHFVRWAKLLLKRKRENLLQTITVKNEVPPAVFSVLTCLPSLEGMSHCQWNRVRVTQWYCSQGKKQQQKNNKTNPQFESTKNNIQDHSWSRSRTISTTATFTQVWHVKSRSLSPEKSGSVFPKEEGIYRHTHVLTELWVP